MSKGPENAIKETNICIMRVPEEKDKEKGVERIFEEMIAAKFPNLMKGMNINIQEP